MKAEIGHQHVANGSHRLLVRSKTCSDGPGLAYSSLALWRTGRPECWPVIREIRLVESRVTEAAPGSSPPVRVELWR